MTTATARNQAERLATSALGESMVDARAISVHLNVSERTIKRWRLDGKMPPPDFELGGIRRWRISTVDDWFSRLRG